MSRMSCPAVLYKPSSSPIASPPSFGPSPSSAEGELLKNVLSLVDTWNKLLKFYAKNLGDQILAMLYDKDIVEEDAILRWADEKTDAEKSDEVFVKQSETFIEWLKNAPEEED